MTNLCVLNIISYYGNIIFGEGNGDSGFAMSSFMEDVKKDTIKTLLLFRFTLLHAIYIWLLAMAVVTLAVYSGITPVLRRVMPKTKNEGKRA